MRILIKTYSDNKKKNSDDYVVFNSTCLNNSEDLFDEPLKIIGVCDGVGGNAGGKFASGFVSDRLSKQEAFPGTVDGLERFFGSVNNELIEYASREIDKKNMATTFSGLIASDSGLFLVHIGNTRVYRKQGQYLKQITEDQTMYQLLLDRGAYEDAEKCNKNEIYACLGGGRPDYARPIIIKQIDEIQNGDLFVITSDGIHEYVSIERLEKFIMNDADKDGDYLDEVLKNARENGSTDDCSLVLIRF